MKALFTAPTAIRAIRKEDPDGAHLGRYDLSALQYLFLAGRAARSRHLPLGVAEARHPGRRPLVADRDGMGDRRQSDGGGAAADQGRFADGADAGLRRAHPARRTATAASPARRARSACGCRCRRVRCRRCGTTTPATRRPTCASIPGYYLTGDGGYLDEDGYLFVMGRIDDVINVAGHRLSTGAIEAVLATHPAVAECAVIGVADEIKGQVPRGFVVLKAGASADGLAEELVEAVRDEIGAVACFKLVDVVAALPKTRSGKILRKTMRGIADGKDEPMPSTIEDPAVLDALRPILQPSASE